MATMGSSVRLGYGAIRAVIIVFLSVLVLLSVNMARSSAAGAPHGVVVSDDPAGMTPNVGDGRVLAITTVGDKIIVGGVFTEVQRAGTSAFLPRVNIFAFDAETGAIDPDFTPTVDGDVYTLAPAPDGQSVIVGGAFANVNGQASYGLAKLDVSDGQRDAAFATTQGTVRDVVVHGGTAYVGGNFWKVDGTSRTRLAAVDAATGSLDTSFNLPVTDPRSGTDTWVDKVDVSPDGSHLIAIGNFLTVDGHSRDQVVMVDLTGPSAVVEDWYAPAYNDTCSSSFWTYVRDAEYSPDGSYFVIVTTGGPRTGRICDSAARWEADDRGENVDPTWVDWTGGDTLYSVTITDEAVYVGGHQRWQNNHLGRDSAGPGAVERPGIAALDPINGVPLAWNPGRDRGVGAFELVATPEYLYMGSDTNLVAEEWHAKLAAFPVAGGSSVPEPTPASLPVGIYVAGNDDSLTVRRYDGAAFSAPSPVADPPFDLSTVRGVFLESGHVYYGQSDGSLYARPFDETTFGPAVDQNTWVDFADATSMSWENGSIFFTRSGDPKLYRQYFSLESGIVGSQVFEMSGDGDGLDWSDTTGIAFADNHLYYVENSGDLYRIDMSGHDPVAGTQTLISGPGAGDGLDWTSAGIFFGPAPNLPPTVSVTSPVVGEVVSGVVDVVASASDDDAVVEVEFFVDAVSIGVDDDGSDGWSVTWDTTVGVNRSGWWLRLLRRIRGI